MKKNNKKSCVENYINYLLQDGIYKVCCECGCVTDEWEHNPTTNLFRCFNCAEKENEEDEQRN